MWPLIEALVQWSNTLSPRKMRVEVTWQLWIWLPHLISASSTPTSQPWRMVHMSVFFHIISFQMPFQPPSMSLLSPLSRGDLLFWIIPPSSYITPRGSEWPSPPMLSIWPPLAPAPATPATLDSLLCPGCRCRLACPLLECSYGFSLT